ncbi:MAG: hypothetical protein K6E92_02035 [Lachnospiraceae bacterium]|nr:hypothetical protein [Lachnospiraceae bacterium]
MAKKIKQKIVLRQPDGKRQTSIVKWYEYSYGPPAQPAEEGASEEAPSEEAASEEATPGDSEEGFALPPSPQSFVDDLVRRKQG